MPDLPDLPRAIKVCAPATIANLGPGFDILGMALAEPFDVILAERTDSPGIVIDSITGDGGKLTLDAAKNTAGVAAAYVLNQVQAMHSDPVGGVKLSLQKG